MNNNGNFPSISVVGATGAVGRVCLQILEKRDYPPDRIALLASERSNGKKIRYKNDSLTVKVATQESFKDSDVVFISADSEVSKNLAPAAAAEGALVIDDGSAFRMEENVPLVIPEVNEEDINFHEGIISIPNCTTTPLVMVLHSIRQVAKIDRVQVATYQAVSGSGTSAVVELQQQTEEFLAKKKINNNVYPHQIAFSLIPQVDDFESDGYTKEEIKMINESRKILHDESMKISATCIRVPVFECHSEVISVDLKEEVDIKEITQCLSSSPGVTYLGENSFDEYPTPAMVAGKDDIFIGRLRKDRSNSYGITFWVVSDNLRKGAALNAIQILDSAVKLGKVPKFQA